MQPVMLFPLLYPDINVLIDGMDHYTRRHSLRVGILCHEIGNILNLSERDKAILTWSGLLHDVGKLSIPDELLLKSEKLMPQEFDIIKNHVVFGVEKVSQMRIPYVNEVATIILHHHEHHDGGGYPHKISNGHIPYLARLVTVIDVYDAIHARRSYHSEKSHIRTIQIMEAEQGETYDALLFRTVKDAIESLPEALTEMLYP